MNAQTIRLIIVLTLAIFAAIYLGISAATAQFEAIAWILGVSTLALCIWLGRKIYLLIPFLTTFGFVLPFGGFLNTPLIAQLLFIGFFTLLFLLRKIPVRFKPTGLDWLAFLLVLSVVQTYVRNPVGLNFLGSSSVGGRPYIIFGITACTSLMLSVCIVPPRDLHLWARLSMLGAISNFALGLVGQIVPAFGTRLGATFSTDLPDPDAGEGPGRISFVRTLGITLSTWVASRISPIRTLVRPGWFFLMLLAVAFAMLSGYRSQFALAVLMLLAGVYYHNKFSGFLFSLALGAMGLVILAIANLIVPLPPNVQRSLSFLPGTWDKQIVQGAEGSTEWRVEMWKDALLTDKWIHNKMLGDGLGFTKDEMERMLAFSEGGLDNRTGSSGLTIQQESMMISGGYHSGPVQTIRTTGYVGLACIWTAMIGVAIHAHRLIIRSQSTEWQQTVLFLCIPLVILPIFWTFLFGTFDKGAAATLMGAALVRLMEQNLPLPALEGRYHPLQFALRPRTENAIRPST